MSRQEFIIKNLRIEKDDLTTLELVNDTQEL